MSLVLGFITKKMPLKKKNERQALFTLPVRRKGKIVDPT